MGVFSTLGNLLLLLKNACLQVVTALTALVAVGNELERMKIRFGWLDERRAELRKAWYASLAVQTVLAVLYALVEHRPDALIIDLLTLAGLFGAVYYLQHRRSRTRDDARDEPDDEPSPAPRRPLQGPRRHRRVRRRTGVDGGEASE